MLLRVRVSDCSSRLTLAMVIGLTDSLTPVALLHDTNVTPTVVLVCGVKGISSEICVLVRHIGKGGLGIPAVVRLAFPTRLLVMVAVMGAGSAYTIWQMVAETGSVGLSCIRPSRGRRVVTLDPGLALRSGSMNCVGIYVPFCIGALLACRPIGTPICRFLILVLRDLRQT